MSGMERFTQRARRVLSLAHQEAERMRQNTIGTEHLLLGLIQEEGGVAGRVLRELGLEPDRVREMVERLSGFGDIHAAARSTFRRASSRCWNLRSKKPAAWAITTSAPNTCCSGWCARHEGLGMDVLRKLGVTAEQIRRQTRRVLQESSTAPAPPAAATGTAASRPTPRSARARKNPRPRWWTNWRWT